MAYLDRNGVVRTADPKKYDMPESGIFNSLFTYLESFVAKTKRASSMNDSQLNALGREIRENVDQTMLLMYINNHLFRMNNYYDYEFIPYKEPDTLYVYKMVQTGEMRDIWSPIKVINYRKTYNIDGYEARSTELVTAQGDDYTKKDEQYYKRYVESAININKLMFDLGADFYKLVREINQIVPFGHQQTIQECITTSKNSSIHYMNPYYYIIDSSGHYFTTRNKILEIAREIARTKQLSRDRIEADNIRNYITVGGAKPQDHASYGLFFKPLNNDLDAIQEYFMRYAVYSSSVELERNATLTSKIGKTAAIKFCTDLGWIIESILPVVKRVTRLPTGPEETILTNNIFKKINHISLLKDYEYSTYYRDNERLSVRGGVQPGDIATVESLIRYIFIHAGLRFNDIISYNPVINGRNVLPIFGVDGNDILVDKDITRDLYSMFSPITGISAIDRRTKRKILLTAADTAYENLNDIDVDDTLGRYQDGKFSLTKTDGLPGKLLDRANELFGVPFEENIPQGISPFISYLKNPTFSASFQEKFGILPTSQHFIPISIVEMVVRFLLGTVKASLVPKLKYEVLDKRLLEKLNIEFGTNFPIGTKFFYIAFRVDVASRITTDLYGHGKRLADYVDENVNKGFSNKWNVKDAGILETISKLERLKQDGQFNKDALKVIADTIYQVTINLWSEPSRSDDFRRQVTNTINSNYSNFDSATLQYLLNSLLEDMRKNSDFS